MEEAENENTLRQKAFSLLQGAYYRIAYLDLNEDRLTDLKDIIPEYGCNKHGMGSLTDEIDYCTENYIAEEDKERFRQVMSLHNIKANFDANPFPIELSYRRMIGGEYQWVRLEVIPVDQYSPQNAYAVWYVKSIKEEKAREMRYQQGLLRANAVLRDSFESANRANHAKTEFLSRMSHDMRTPMTSILGMTALASAHMEDRERVADCLNKITISGRHLLALINEVLDMSRIESGKIDLVEEEFNILELMDNLLNILKESWEEKQQKVCYQIGELEHKRVLGDSLRLQQAIINILSNAIKYTHNQGQININLREIPVEQNTSCCFEFVFEDNGIGMTPEFVKRIFEPFTRAEDDRAIDVQGTGLGMTIAYTLVRMMNGDIRVESEWGKGSRFIMTVSFNLPSEKMASDGDGRQNKPAEKPLSLGDFAQEKFIGKHVLLAEDNDVNRDMIVEILQMVGIEVDEAENGKIALSKIAESTPGYYDLVLMDIQMPVMDGYQATAAIRSLNREDVKELPIIAMTANAFAEDVLAAERGGMNGHLAKPFEIRKLQKTLRYWL